MKAFWDRLDARSIMAFMLVFCVMALAFILAINQPESDIFKIMLGTIIGSALSSVVQWYFGSSSGSAMKDEVMAKAASIQNETIAKQSDALASSAPIAAPNADTK